MMCALPTYLKRYMTLQGPSSKNEYWLSFVLYKYWMFIKTYHDEYTLNVDIGQL